MFTARYELGLYIKQSAPRIRGLRSVSALTYSIVGTSCRVFHSGLPTEILYAQTLPCMLHVPPVSTALIVPVIFGDEHHATRFW